MRAICRMFYDYLILCDIHIKHLYRVNENITHHTFLYLFYQIDTEDKQHNSFSLGYFSLKYQHDSILFLLQER